MGKIKVETIELGARRSNIHLCIYDKNKEQRLNHKTPCTRIELRIKNGINFLNLEQEINVISDALSKIKIYDAAILRTKSTLTNDLIDHMTTSGVKVALGAKNRNEKLKIIRELSKFEMKVIHPTKHLKLKRTLKKVFNLCRAKPLTQKAKNLHKAFKSRYKW